MSDFQTDNFAKAMLSGATKAASFKPTAFYHPEGDSLEFIVKPGPFYGKRVDDLVTVYYSEENDEIVGSFVKGVHATCERLLKVLPGFRIVIEEKPVKLEH